MGFKKVLLHISEIIVLIGGVLFLILGFLALFDNKVIYEKLLKIEDEKHPNNNTYLTMEEVIKKRKTHIVLELFTASTVDFILMFLCIYKMRESITDNHSNALNLVPHEKKKDDIEEEILSSSDNLDKGTPIN